MENNLQEELDWLAHNHFTEAGLSAGFRYSLKLSAAIQPSTADQRVSYVARPPSKLPIDSISTSSRQKPGSLSQAGAPAPCSAPVAESHARPPPPPPPTVRAAELAPKSSTPALIDLTSAPTKPAAVHTPATPRVYTDLSSSPRSNSGDLFDDFDDSVLSEINIEELVAKHSDSISPSCSPLESLSGSSCSTSQPRMDRAGSGTGAFAGATALFADTWPSRPAPASKPTPLMKPVPNTQSYSPSPPASADVIPATPPTPPPPSRVGPPLPASASRAKTTVTSVSRPLPSSLPKANEPYRASATPLSGRFPSATPSGPSREELKAKLSTTKEQLMAIQMRDPDVEHALHDILPFGRPEATHVVVRPGYVAAVDKRTKNPLWTAEHLTQQNLQSSGDGVASRNFSSFKEDPTLAAHHRARLDDFKQSGFDRGHLVPAADLRRSQRHMDGTFYLSNVSPQVAAFNRHYWARFESFVRRLARCFDDVWVFTGPLFLPQRDPSGRWFVKYQVIGSPPNVSVPTHFFKVILARRDNDYAAGAFVLPNEPIGDKVPLEAFAVDLRELERQAGLTFFERLEQLPARPLCEATKCQLPPPGFWQAAAAQRKAAVRETKDDIAVRLHSPRPQPQTPASVADDRSDSNADEGGADNNDDDACSAATPPAASTTDAPSAAAAKPRLRKTRSSPEPVRPNGDGPAEQRQASAATLAMTGEHHRQPPPKPLTNPRSSVDAAVDAAAVGSPAAPSSSTVGPDVPESAPAAPSVAPKTRRRRKRVAAAAEATGQAPAAAGASNEQQSPPRRPVESTTAPTTDSS